jgi:hypothetical protein
MVLLMSDTVLIDPLLDGACDRYEDEAAGQTD